MNHTIKSRGCIDRLLGIWGWNNRRSGITPVIKKYKVQSAKVNKRIRIVHLSDLHCCYYGNHQKRLCRLVDDTSPDLICMTGDMLEPKFSRDAAGDLFSYLASRYPCYFVTGNHEYNYRNVKGVKAYVRSFGIHLLSGTGQWFVSDSKEKIYICGIDDPSDFRKGWKNELNSIASSIDPEYFSVFLTHRPEKAPMYAKLPFDLVLSGHAHGGQWQIPGIVNGLFAPGQGFFPEYAGGRYDFKKQVHINSRGLAYYVPIPRFFNPVEFGVIDIEPDSKK